MALELPRWLVEFILLGPEDDRRQLQDSPILGDVWFEFAKDPVARLELLITPYRENAAGMVATVLADCVEPKNGKAGTKARKRGKEKSKEADEEDDKAKGADVAYLQGIVAARLSFQEVLRFVVPMTYWWSDERIKKAIENYKKKPSDMRDDLGSVFQAASDWPKVATIPIRDFATHKRYITLTGLILWARDQQALGEGSEKALKQKLLEKLLERKTQDEIVKLLSAELEELHPPKKGLLVWHVSRNRPASAALTKSVPAVKADSARSLFTVNCSEIVWAVIDSGIQARHPAFMKDGKSRVRKSFDFTRIREIVSLANASEATAGQLIDKLRKSKELHAEIDDKEAIRRLMQLAQGARDGRSINWELVEPLIEIDEGIPPRSNHGTHVAGILAASKEAATRDREKDSAVEDFADGMCPDIQVYDFRVLSPKVQETEFAIIAALQYIRYINERNSFMTIHGANLSLSIRHDVRNYACGRTPVCNECERLVNSGVVVVAAAGNRGYQGFETKEGLYEGYAAFSVTDPGNADGVITVGSTHRFWPHTYGVSFFSSRGPTGDGRLKPDLVAPGERIRAPLPEKSWGDLDGTSMAAPHVSGAAAMLMARYSELVGQPRRIKQILCESATDLGREKTFQGHGMLDVLRAFQSI